MTRTLSALVLAVLLTACAVPFVLLDPPAGCAWVGCRTPSYTPQIENIQILKYGSFHSVRLSAFRAKSPDVNSVWLRATSPMKSSVGTFEQYLEQALRRELDEAGLLEPNSTLELSGILLRNNVTTPVKTGTVDLEASFTLKRAGAVVYEETKSTHHEWESAFGEATAIPAAVQNYPIAVQKLIRALVTDPEFQKALKE